MEISHLPKLMYFSFYKMPPCIRCGGRSGHQEAKARSMQGLVAAEEEEEEAQEEMKAVALLVWDVAEVLALASALLLRHRSARSELLPPGAAAPTPPHRER